MKKFISFPEREQQNNFYSFYYRGTRNGGGQPNGSSTSNLGPQTWRQMLNNRSCKSLQVIILLFCAIKDILSLCKVPIEGIKLLYFNRFQSKVKGLKVNTFGHFTMKTFKSLWNNSNKYTFWNIFIGKEFYSMLLEKEVERLKAIPMLLLR